MIDTYQSVTKQRQRRLDARFFVSFRFYFILFTFEFVPFLMERIDAILVQHVKLRRVTYMQRMDRRWERVRVQLCHK